MTQSDHSVREHAYALWERAGCPADASDRYWLQAEQELAALVAQAKPTRSAAPKPAKAAEPATPKAPAKALAKAKTAGAAKAAGRAKAA